MVPKRKRVRDFLSVSNRTSVDTFTDTGRRANMSKVGLAGVRPSGVGLVATNGSGRPDKMDAELRLKLKHQMNPKKSKRPT